jgi:hypothetical protein
MIVVACLALGLTLARGVYYGFATRYTWGFRESQFRMVRVGMTPEEVEKILGAPFQKDSKSPRWSPIENWMYSEPAVLTNDEWRKWVMFQNGKVLVIIDEYVKD